MLLVFILLTDKWYNKIVSFVLVYILDSLLYQALALICDLILGFPIFVGMNTVKEKKYNKNHSNPDAGNCSFYKNQEKIPLFLIFKK